MIEIKHLSKTFQMKDGAVNALKNIDLTIPDGSIRDGQVDVVQRVDRAVFHLESLGKVFDLDHRNYSLLLNKLLQSNPCGFASSLKEGAADKAEKLPALPRAPSQRGLSPKATGGVLFAHYLFFSSSSLLLALP